MSDELVYANDYAVAVGSTNERSSSANYAVGKATRTNSSPRSQWNEKRSDDSLSENEFSAKPLLSATSTQQLPRILSGFCGFRK
jgi:hypothetical protein